MWRELTKPASQPASQRGGLSGLGCLASRAGVAREGLAQLTCAYNEEALAAKPMSVMRAAALTVSSARSCRSRWPSASQSRQANGRRLHAGSSGSRAMGSGALASALAGAAHTLGWLVLRAGSAGPVERAQH